MDTNQETSLGARGWVLKVYSASLGVMRIWVSVMICVCAVYSHVPECDIVVVATSIADRGVDNSLEIASAGDGKFASGMASVGRRAGDASMLLTKRTSIVYLCHGRPLVDFACSYMETRTHCSARRSLFGTLCTGSRALRTLQSTRLSNGQSCGRRVIRRLPRRHV